MATSAEVSPPLLDVPLDLVTLILECLDDFTDVLSAIHAHRIFLTPYRQHTDSILNTIISNTIPPTTLPYVLQTVWAVEIDPSLAGDFLRDYAKNVTYLRSIPRIFADLERNQRAALMRNYRAARAICDEWARYALPNLRQKLGIEHVGEMSEGEVFRVVRALMRFQAVVGVCRVMDQQARREDLKLFFRVHAPWVNQQLHSVYDFLEKTISEAVREVAQHDVGWGGRGIVWRSDFARREYIQGYLYRGLPFLARLCRARGYDEHLEILGLPEVSPHTDFWKFPRRLLWTSGILPDDLTRLGFTNEERVSPLSEIKPDRLALLHRSLDMEDDSLEGYCYKAWRAALWDTTLGRASDGAWDGILRDTGYAIWDHAATVPAGEYEGRIWLYMQGKSDGERVFVQVGRDRVDDLEAQTLSTRQRVDIWRRGGSGYWDGKDFSRVKGLTEKDVRWLKQKWEREGRGEVVEARSD